MNFREMLAQQWARYERLSDREQLLAAITACVVGLACFIFFVWDPIAQSQKSAEQRYAEEFELQSELIALQLQKKPVNNSDAIDNEQSLLAIVNKSTSSRGISLKRVEPKSDQSLRVWIENVSFHQLIDWIGLLRQKYGINIITITLDKTPAPGYINTAFVVSR